MKHFILVSTLMLGISSLFSISSQASGQHPFGYPDICLNAPRVIDYSSLRENDINYQMDLSYYASLTCQLRRARAAKSAARFRAMMAANESREEAMAAAKMHVFFARNRISEEEISEQEFVDGKIQLKIDDRRLICEFSPQSDGKCLPMVN